MVATETDDEVRALGLADPAVSSSLARLAVCAMPEAIAAARDRPPS